MKILVATGCCLIKFHCSARLRALSVRISSAPKEPSQVPTGPPGDNLKSEK